MDNLINVVSVNILVLQTGNDCVYTSYKTLVQQQQSNGLHTYTEYLSSSVKHAEEACVLLIQAAEVTAKIPTEKGLFLLFTMKFSKSHHICCIPIELQDK